MDTLEDLVDVAIDCEKRIVYDSAQERYAVIEVNTTYIYAEAS